MTRIIGVVHLAALPGSPRSSMPLSELLERAVADAVALEAGGVDALIVENFNDAPYRPGPVEPHTVAAMTAACLAIRSQVGCTIGVNVLRNDAAAALGIAAATGAGFIRVNVHTGAMLTDQGVISGRADKTLRLRRALDVEHIEVYADVLVKHAVSLAPIAIGDAVRDTVERGLADAIIVSGTGTGFAAEEHDVWDASAATRVPVLVGSGVSPENAGRYFPPCAGAIVGTWFKRDGIIGNPVDIERVRMLRNVVDQLAIAPSMHRDESLQLRRARGIGAIT